MNLFTSIGKGLSAEAGRNAMQKANRSKTIVTPPLDDFRHPYDPKEGGMRVDRYREDEQGIGEWLRRGGANPTDQGDGTAPAIPPTILQGGADADRRGEIPDPRWLQEWYRAKHPKKNLDVTKA